MTGNGYILLHRCLMDKPIWFQSTPEQKVILVTLLLMANHEQSEWIWQGIKFEVQPGQFVTSIDRIVKKAGVSKQSVRTALVKFEKLEFLTNKSTKTGRLISIVNWHTYQVEKRKSNKDANKDLTKNQQRPNKDLTPNKNDKECKNDKKYIYSENIELQKAINDFILMRRSIKKPMTEHAIELMLGKLNKLATNDQDKIKILNQSIMNSYQGIFPLKERTQHSNLSYFEEQKQKRAAVIEVIKNATGNSRPNAGQGNFKLLD